MTAPSAASPSPCATAPSSVSPPPRPVPDVDSAPFWEAAREGRLALCRCQDCKAWLQPPLERCRHCAGPTSFEDASGDGEVYSFIVVRHPSVPAFVSRMPYVVALVDLDEGVRLPARLVGVEPTDVSVGLRVQVAVDADPLPGADAPSVVFRPAR